MKKLSVLLHSIFLLTFLSPQVFAIADKDADGMSDVWELANGFSTAGNANPSQAPTADPDGDGVSNLKESIAGTNPLNANGPLGKHQVTISKNLITSGAFNLQWRQLTGKQYSVFSSSNLASGSWLPLGTSFTGTPTQLTITASPTPGVRHAFYRVTVSDIDPDSDNLSSYEENVIGTNPANSDTDSDALPDGYEYQYGGTSGLNAGDDLDGDSLNNLAEAELGTSPLSTDTDNDQTGDAAEAEQDSSPTNGGDLGIVRNGKIRLRVGTGTFLGPSYPFPAYPVYPINIYRRNMTTGAETLLWSVPTVDFFNAQNIDLPNDGSVYSLQVEMPFYGSEFGLPFRDFKWACSCFSRVGSAPIAILDNFDTTTNAFGVAGRLLGTPPQNYDYNFRRFRALIIPVNVDYVARNPDTGLANRVNALVEGSDSRPEVKITSSTATINASNQLSVTVSGTVREPLSETLASAAGATSSLALYIDGEFIENITNLTPAPVSAPVRSPWLRRDSTVQFTKTILIDNAAPGMRNIRLFSNANALGKKGFDGVTVLVEKQNYSPVTITSPPSFRLALPASFTVGVDSLTITSGGVSSTLTEEASAPNSGLFTGTLTLNGAARAIGVQIPAALPLSGTIADRFDTNIVWREGTKNLSVNGTWLETSVSSRVFNAIAASVDTRSNDSTNLVIAGISNDPNVETRSISPTALRLEVPSNFDFFGSGGLLTTELNGSPATFHEHPSALPYGPPPGKKWFYYGTAAEPQIFVLNEALNGTAQSPSNIFNAGKFDLTVKLRSSGAIAFNDTSSIREYATLKELRAPAPAAAPVLGTPSSKITSPGALEGVASSAATLPTYTMAEVRFWFAFLFDDAGEELLLRYETATATDAGLAISLQSFWSGDSNTYKLAYTVPYYQITGGSDPRPPQLFLNRRQLGTPIDAAAALFAAIQELRNTSQLYLRTGLVIDYLEVVDNYLNGNLPDAEVEQALRNGRLGPIKDVLLAAKSGFEFGFSFLPGGDLIITVNDVDEAVQAGNLQGAAVSTTLFFTPKLIDKVGTYCSKRAVSTILNFGPAGTVTLTPPQLRAIAVSGILDALPKIGRGQKRAEKIANIKLLLEQGVLDKNKIGIYYDSGLLELSAGISRTTLGRNLEAAGFTRNPTSRAHHWLPIAQKAFDAEKQFIIRGIDPNLAIHGELMDEAKHKIIHGKGTTGWFSGDTMLHQWKGFFQLNSGATPTEVFAFRDQLKALCSGDVTSADLIAWPIPKTFVFTFIP